MSVNVLMPWIDAIRDCGSLYSQFENYERNLVSRDICSRIFSKDAGVWSGIIESPETAEHCVDWTDSLERSVSMISEVPKASSDISTIILIGTGGASNAAKAYASIGSSETNAGLQVLDSTSPKSLGPAIDHTNSRDRHYIVSSKSGRTVETFDIARTIFDRVRDPSQFSVVTDPSASPLRDWAQEHEIVSYSSDPYVLGRFSALSTLGLVPVKMLGLNLGDIHRSHDEFIDAIRSSDSKTSNEVRMLSAILAASADEAGSRLVLSAQVHLLPVLQWIEQIVAESLGKSGYGTLPVIQLLTPNDPQDNTLLVFIDSDQTERVLILDEQLSDATKLAHLFLVWETAISMAGYLLGINPFNQPNVEQSKQMVSNTLKSNEDDGGFLSYDEIVIDGSEDSVDAVQELMLRLKETVGVHDYVCFLVFTAPTAEIYQLLSQCVSRVTEALGRTVVCNFGPQYLHSTGQFHKGGPKTGHYLIFRAEENANLEVHERPYTFGHLTKVQACADAFVLAELNRPVYHIVLKEPTAESLSSILNVLQS